MHTEGSVASPKLPPLLLQLNPFSRFEERKKFALYFTSIGRRATELAKGAFVA
jgi:hypothetical protein